MKRQTALSLLLVLLLAACQPLARPVAEPAELVAAQPSAEAAAAGAALQGLLDEQVRAQGILGMAMGVRLADGTIVFRQSGSTDPAGEDPWTLDTQSALGSITKTYSAVVIMQLVNEGRLTLDDTIDAWFPDHPNGDKITVRMLLSHTSGIDNPIPPESERDPKWSQPWTPMELIAEANRRGPASEPGSSVALYSNTGYYMVGLIIEAITGNKWEEEIHTRIIDPLNLQHTAIIGEEGVWGGSLLPGYAKMDGGYISTLEISGLPHQSTGWAVGSIVSSVGDMLTFAGALFDGRLVPAETLAEMATPVATDAGTPRLWGLGGATLIDMPAGFGMGGDNPGYRSFFIGIQGTKYLVAGLINTEGGDVVGPGLLALQYLVEQAAGGLAEPQSPDAAAALQGLVDSQVAEQNILGMTMAARLPDGSIVTGSSGSSDREGKSPWSPETQSALGSITKTFTAVVIMQLVEEGLLGLDDTIDSWFPDQPNGDKITVRMLLSHTSGLAGYITGENVFDPKWGHAWVPADLVAEANAMGPVDQPGSAIAHYSNTGYVVLGLIIEAITGNRWEKEIQARIFEPLALADTTFLDAEGVWGGSMTEGYTRTAEGYVSTLELPNYPHPTTTWAAGAIVSTLADLMTFAGALFDGELVSQETLAEMATVVAPDDSSPLLWGLGGATLGDLSGSFGMGGDIPGYHAFFVGIQGTPLVVAGLINTEEGDIIGPSLTALQYLGSMP